MLNGRPADGSYYTLFYSYLQSQNVDSLKLKTNVEGWQCISAQVDKERRWNG
jgi:hypothetical protein